MKNTLFLPAWLLTLLFLGGCVSTGMHTSTHLTNVELSEANYRVVARSVSGEAKAGYVLGVSFGMGMYAQVVGVARINGEKALYKAAMDDLWKNYEAKHGPVEGKRLALTNIRYDNDALNLFFYTEPHVIIQADIIEFTE